MGKWRYNRDLGLACRNPGKKSTESVKKQANGHFCSMNHNTAVNDVKLQLAVGMPPTAVRL